MKTNTFFATLWIILIAPLLCPAQHLTEYQPANALLVSTPVNLVTLQGSNAADVVPGFTRSVSTLGEAPGVAAPADVWFKTVNDLGFVVNSFRFGLPNIHEDASAIETASNGDYLILANIQNFAAPSEIWIFRITAAGAVVWSNRYFIPNSVTRGYCIKRTNEPGETYIIAGTTDNDKTLLGFKIDGGGIVQWNFTYADPNPNNIFDVPRSMVKIGLLHVIAGNRRLGNAADIFTIGIDVTGAIVRNYNYIDNNNQADVNPFINLAVPGTGAAFVLTYQTFANIGGILTGRIAYTPLNAGLGILGATQMYWELGSFNSYGHTIHQLPAAAGYYIGAGTTSGGGQIAISLGITPAGAVIAFRKLWLQQNVTSTYLLNDEDPVLAGTPIQYAHHSYNQLAGGSNIFIFRDLANCFLPRPILQQNVLARQVIQPYSTTSPLQDAPYAVTPIIVHGKTLNCAGGGSIFRTAGEGKSVVAEKATPTLFPNGFRVYPSLLQGNSQLTVEWSTATGGQQTINVYNLQSQLVLQRRVSATEGGNKVALDAAALKPGTFIVEVQGGAESFRTRIVKQ